MRAPGFAALYLQRGWTSGVRGPSAMGGLWVLTGLAVALRLRWEFQRERRTLLGEKQ